MVKNKWMKRVLSCVLFGAALVFLGANVWALTPAGTEIRNQSVATYRDANNQPQISTSNEVFNIVEQVYGLEITPDKTGGAGVPFTYTNTAALTQTTAPGNVAYFHYYLKNTGNTPDTYDLTAAFNPVAGAIIAPNGVEVYYDANGNGQVDAGDILLANTAGGIPAATPIVAQDATIPLIVAVQTPTNATDAQQINTDIQGQSNGSGPVVADAVSNWNRTLFSASTGILTATKSADVSSAIPGQVLTYTVEGSNTGSADVFSVVYGVAGPRIDLNGDNTMENREGVLIIDELDPAKLVVDDGTSPAGGPYNYGGIASPTVLGPTKARILYWDQSSVDWHSNAADAEWTTTPKIALFIPDADSVEANPAGNGLINSVLSPGQGYKFTFKVNVQSPYSTAEAKLIENMVEVSYSKNIGGDLVDIESNKALVTVGADPLTLTAGAAIGPFGHPMADTAPLTLTSANHPSIDAKGLTVLAGTSDTTRAGIRDAGEVIAFPVTILNPNENLPKAAKLGIGGPATSVDTYNITYVNPNSSSYSVVLFKSDGVTPLADTNGDGVPDTGAIDPAATASIVVKVFIAANAEVPGASQFTVNASSTNDPTKVDPTYLHIAEVRPASVDIAISGQLGNDDNATAADATAVDDDDATTSAGVDPGAVVVFPVDIGNMRPEAAPGGADTTTSSPDTYNLTFTKIVGATDASPFVVQLLKDDGDGVIGGDELVPISDTGWLPAIADVDSIQASEIFNLNVRVQVPLGTPAGDYFVDVKATSTNNPAKSDTMRLLVRVSEAPSIQVIPDNTATVVAGGSYIFSHVIVNTGNVADTVTVSHSVLPNGYSAVWVNCATGTVNGNGDNPNTHTTASIKAPAPGVDNTVTVCLKVFVPANAPAGSVVPITVTGEMDSYAPFDTALDIITVIDGALQLLKTNNPTVGTEIPPGGTITYRTAYKNLSPGTLSLAVIADAIPANTKLVVSDATIAATLPIGTALTGADNTYFQYSTNNGVSWNLWPADETTLPGYNAGDSTASGITNIRFDIGNTSNTTTPGGNVPAGEDGWFEFRVIVK